MPAAREHQHIEWKQSWRDEYLKWVCGFANAEGGTFVIGRNDEGEAAEVNSFYRVGEIEAWWVGEKLTANPQRIFKLADTGRC